MSSIPLQGLLWRRDRDMDELKFVGRHTARGNTLSWQRSSGHLVDLGEPRTQNRTNLAIKVGSMPVSKLMLRGVNMGQHLSLISDRKATGGKARVRTGLGKSDCPGSQGGLRKRGLW